jgi:hypothetical protein
MRVVLRRVRQVKQRFHRRRQKLPGALADALGRVSQIEKGDHRRRPFFAAASAHRLRMFLREQAKSRSAATWRAAFRTTGFLRFFDQSNSETFHTIAPIVSFGPRFTEG